MNGIPAALNRNDRVRLSAEGRRLLLTGRSRLTADSAGRFVGLTRTGFASVRFDGYRAYTYLHPDFLERIE